MSIALPRPVVLRIPGIDLVRTPRASTTLVTCLAALAAVFPSLIPHSALLQGLALALFPMIALAVTRRLRPRAPRASARARAVVAACSLSALTAGAWWAVAAQDAQRMAAGMPPTGLPHWLVAVAVAAAVVGVVRTVRWAVRHPRRAWPPALGLAVAALLLGQALPVHAAGGVSTDRVLLQPSPTGAVRAYAAERDGESLASRANRAADLLVARGGLARDRVVVMVPTGSGWVDPAAVQGFEDRFGADVAMVGMQYASTPSWVAYLFQRGSAVEGARALLDAVTARVDALPADQRPDVHLYGESLGALAGQSALRAPGRAAQVCSALWVGSPGGASAGVGVERQVANADDPVVHATPWLAVRPSGSGTPWLPGVSYAQAAFDFVGSLGVPEGHGHRYGTDQVAALPNCAPRR